MTLYRVTLPAPPPLCLLQVYKNVHSTVEEGGDEETRAAITAKVLHPDTSHCLVCIESSSPFGRLHSPFPPTIPSSLSCRPPLQHLRLVKDTPTLDWWSWRR